MVARYLNSNGRPRFGDKYGPSISPRSQILPERDRLGILSAGRQGLIFYTKRAVIGSIVTALEWASIRRRGTHRQDLLFVGRMAFAGEMNASAL